MQNSGFWMGLGDLRKKNKILEPERLIGLLFVLALHGALLFGLWRYQIIPAPAEAVTLMVELINPMPPDKPKQPEPPRTKPHPVELPKPLMAKAPVVLPDEAVAPPPAPDEPVVPQPATVLVAPSLPPQPVALANELSVSCPERSPPDYPAASVRLNEQGRVVLRVELGSDGRISGVSFVSHSGYARLDEAALNAVKTWRCKPAIRGGIAVAALALQPFDFILEGR